VMGVRARDRPQHRVDVDRLAVVEARLEPRRRGRIRAAVVARGAGEDEVVERVGAAVRAAADVIQRRMDALVRDRRPAPDAVVAVAILEGARARTGLDGPTARLLIERHASTEQVGAAVEVALESLHLLPQDDVRNMIASLESWGERPYAAALLAAAGPQRTATTNSRGKENSRLPSARAGYAASTPRP